jgi:3-oxoacyl-[acyl-carrier protein] reductase
MRLKGRTAIVTGGASGFGAGIARRFAEEGAAVVIADVDETRAVEVADGIAAASGKAHVSVCDVTVPGDIAELIDDALTTFGAIDIVVNNAGVPQVNCPMLEVDEETFDRIFAVNVKSIYLMARQVVPAMRQVGGGVILNTASTAALRPRPGLTWYNGSKGAVVTLTKSMAAELAPDRIRVNALCPVAGDTPMLAAFMGGAVTNEMQEKFIATIPLGRLSSPRDMANAALFLASDEAEFLTGVCLEVDGGRCI